MCALLQEYVDDGIGDLVGEARVVGLVDDDEAEDAGPAARFYPLEGFA